jgi:hypothetical protein
MNYMKIIEMLVPVLLRALEFLLKKEEKRESKDEALANAMRNQYPDKSDEQIIEEAFA